MGSWTRIVIFITAVTATGQAAIAGRNDGYSPEYRAQFHRRHHLHNFHPWDVSERDVIAKNKETVHSAVSHLQQATKRSDIDKPSSNSSMSKRGFLANLATLLNDADALSAKKNESGLSSISASLSPKDSVAGSSTTASTQKTVAEIPTEMSASKPPVEEHSARTPKKAEKPSNTEKDAQTSLPSVADVQKELNTSEKDSAPIFALFHGKIVPLGKLPDTSFKKSRTEDHEESATALSTPPSSGKADSHDPDVSSEDRASNLSPGHVTPMVEHRTSEDGRTSTTASRHDIPQEKHLSPVSEEPVMPNIRTITEDHSARLSKLQKYLTNLDGHSQPTGMTKDVRGVAKDEVVFPETENPTPKSSIMNHVKGLVLDNGKIVTVDGKSEEKNSEEKEVSDPPAAAASAAASSDSSEKFYVTDDGTLYPLTKSKPVTADPVARDISSTGEEDGKKTVAVSLDMLKDLLKKTDAKISLAQLLNKGSNAEEKSEVTEDEDPGTIEDFAAGGLKAHNEYRRKHHDGDLLWSDDLATKAQKLAESLADKKTLEIAKDLEKEGYGENVAKVWATFKNAGEAAAKMWYTQSENYRFDDPHLDENTGQFAQVVWKSTKELGMGVAKSIDDVNNKYVYVVALYRPPGNIEAQLRDNVLPTGNNTVDVYSTFFKRSHEVNTSDKQDNKRSKLYRVPLQRVINDED